MLLKSGLEASRLGYYNINVDASVCLHTGTTRIGYVVRDHAGAVLQVKDYWRWEVDVAEATTVHFGLSLA